MNRIIEYLAKLLEGKDRKKLIELLVAVAILGIAVIIVSNSLFGSKGVQNEVPENTIKESAETAAVPSDQEDRAVIEKEIEGILSKIDGAGKVDAMVTYISGKEVVPAYDTKKNENGTDEKDTSGGTRNIRQNDFESKIAYEETQGGSRKPVVLKEMLPEVKGVVIVADGAGDAQVKESLSRAVQVLLDVPIHRIQVFEREK